MPSRLGPWAWQVITTWKSWRWLGWPSPNLITKYPKLFQVGEWAHVRAKDGKAKWAPHKCGQLLLCPNKWGHTNMAGPTVMGPISWKLALFSASQPGSTLGPFEKVWLAVEIGSSERWHVLFTRVSFRGHNVESKIYFFSFRSDGPPYLVEGENVVMGPQRN